MDGIHVVASFDSRKVVLANRRAYKVRRPAGQRASFAVVPGSISGLFRVFRVWEVGLIGEMAFIGICSRI